jgi:serine/threonine protein kinase
MSAQGPTPAEADGTEPAAGEDELAQVLDAYLAEVEAGRPVDPQEWVDRHPAIAERLRACLKGLHLVEAAAEALDLAPAPGPGPGSAEARRTDQDATDDAGHPPLGDFRIVRELGRGGMGVVYEAQQRSLGRRVALKVLPYAAAIDPRQIARFRVEAQAASQLHHPHIVPVYSVGCQHGVHYYAMQLIEGPTLAELIARLRRPIGPDAATEPTGPGPGGADPVGARPGAADPLGPAMPGGAPRTAWSLSTTSTRSLAFCREAARLGLQAAEALDHAHQQGVLHRDVKPSNLLVDGRGHLWITDFGLARFQGEGSLTATGDLLGTLRYMSPEQALANRAVVDERTDVYSLGATLYELVTLRPALEGTDRQDLLRRIAQEEPRRPRALNPAVPVDLETIVLKAMAKDPAGRYATARELAEDLGRFLDDRPIQARRPGPLERSARWVRRHAAVVLAVVPLLAVIALGLGVGIVLALAKQAEIHRNQAEIERAHAEARRQRDEARRAVDVMYTQVAEDWLGRQPHLQALQRDFLLKALDYYRAFALDDPADPAGRAEAGAAAFRVGEIQRQLGRGAEAERAYRQAITMLQALDPTRRGSPARAGAGHGPEARATAGHHDPLEALARGYGGLGELLLETGRPEEAQAALLRAAELTRAQVDHTPDSPAGRLVLASGYQRLGTLLRLAGRLPEAEAAYRKALALNEAIGPPRRLKQAGTHADLAIVLSQTGRPDEAQQSYRRAAELYETLVAAEPGMPLYRRELAGTLLNLGVLLANEAGGLAEAERALGRALALYERLSADAPGVAQFGRERAAALLNLGSLLGATGRTAGAEPLLRRAVAAHEALAAGRPDQPSVRSNLALARSRLAALQAARGDGPEARRLLEQAVAHQREALRSHPGDALGLQRLWSQREALAGVLIRLGAHAEAAALAEDLLREAPADRRATTPALAATLLTGCAAAAARDPALDRDIRAATARSYAARARDLLRDAARAGGADPAAPYHLAWFLTTCPVAELRDPAEAGRIARAIVERAPGAWISWATLGGALYRAGAWTDALEALERAAELNQGSLAFYGFFLAMAYHRLDDPDRARSHFEQTDRWLKSMPWDEAAGRLRAETAELLGIPPAAVTENPRAPK